MSIADLSLDISPPAYGLLRLDEHRNLACVICVVREEGERCSDWLDVCVPTGALEQLFHVEYPLVREGNRWLHELDVTFLGLADRVHAATAFDLAFVGEEVSGYADARELLACDAATRRERLGRTTYLVSPRLNEQLRLNARFERCASGLLWRTPS